MQGILRYSPLSDTNNALSSRRSGQNSAALCLGETSEWDKEDCNFHRKSPNECQLGNVDIIFDKEGRGKRSELGNESLQRENEYLRNQLAAATSMLQKMKSQEDEISRSNSGSDHTSVSSARSFKMRCSVLGRKKSKKRVEGGGNISAGGRCSPSDASTVVMGSQSKQTIPHGCVIGKKLKYHPKKSFGSNMWRRLGDSKRRYLSPTRSCSRMAEKTPPCTPERSTTKDAWSSNLNKNRHLSNPPWSNQLQLKPQERVRVFQPQPLGIEACLRPSQSEKRSDAENMFMSFRTAVSSEVLTIDKSNLQEI